MDEEKKHLASVFKGVGYKEKETKKTIERAERRVLSQEPKAQDQPQCGRVFLPYIQGVTNKLAKILRRKDIVTQFATPRTVKQGIRSVKDDIDRHQLKGVYKIKNCSCGRSYIGETGRSLQKRLKEHGVDIKNGRSRTSSLVEHSSKTKHHVCLESLNYRKGRTTSYAEDQEGS